MSDVAAFCSFGNDSIALIRHLYEQRDPGDKVYIIYSDTGWAAPWWQERVDQGTALAESYGFEVIVVRTEGFESLVMRKKAFPRSGMQFCTTELKIKPGIAVLDELDPEGEIVCAVGVRREESAARVSWPEWVEESDKHGGRSLWSPLVRLSTAERDVLIAKTNMEVLPHRSMECFPCVNANRADLRLLTEDRIALIEKMEKVLGRSAAGKIKAMFRPRQHMGAEGIREVMRWARSDRGKFVRNRVCDSGFCGG